ncbi:MAG: hypothetical protein ACR2OX_12585 [Methyloligellaceae bacterium]
MNYAKLCVLSAILVVHFCSSAFAKTVALIASKDCRDQIGDMVCLVKPVQHLFRRSDLLSRTCLPSSDTYKSTFLEIFDAYPKPLRNKMCGLNRIFIEQSFWASGYAHVKTNAIGVRQDILDKHLSLSEWATWKERRAYDNPKASDKADTDLPRVSAHLPLLSNGAAYYIVTHELAHLIDMATGASDLGKQSFADWSWKKANKRTVPQGLSPDWKRPCFYFCGHRSHATTRPQNAYEMLRKSPFISLYATRNPAEDFAETLTFFVSSKQTGFRYVIHLADGSEIDIPEKLESELMRPKIEYIVNMLQRMRYQHRKCSSRHDREGRASACS